MANTIVEYEYLGVDTIKQGIADELAVTSDLLRYLPFREITGNSLKYNIKTARKSNAWIQPGGTVAEATPTWEQRSCDLSILIGDADIDQFAQQTQKDQDIGAAVIAECARDLAYDFEKECILGQTTSAADTDAIKGLLLLAAECETSSTTDLDAGNNSQVIAGHATSAALTIDMLDELIDAIEGKPDALIMNKRMRRKLKSLARAAGNNLEVGEGKLGLPVEYYGTIPILIDDHIPSNLDNNSSSVLSIASYDPTTTRAADYDNSVIFAVKFGEDGVMGLHNGGIQTEDVGIVQNKDAIRTRLKFYCGMACFNKKGLAVLTGVLDTALS